MYDRYDRRIRYLRISVTDRCNLRCRYCMPEDGVPLRSHAEMISYERIVEVVREAALLGIDKVRLTGGEPLVRRGIADLIAMLAKVPGLSHVAMTTNGVLLPDYAASLRAAGLSSINVSLDTLDPDRYRAITRGGDIRRPLAGIEAALREGFPLKINMVVMEDTPGDETERMRAFCGERGIRLQLINHYSLGRTKRDDYVFDRPPRCSECDRIRLLSDGTLKPCLHSNDEIPVDFSNIRESLERAILAKPAAGGVCDNRDMAQIGG